jgi:hypothetical protein
MPREIYIEPGDELTLHVTVKGALCDWFIECIKASGEEMANPVHYHALGHLVGITPSEAVRIANRWADGTQYCHITTRDFCTWLANILSHFFASSYEHD